RDVRAAARSDARSVDGRRPGVARHRGRDRDERRRCGRMEVVPWQRSCPLVLRRRIGVGLHRAGVALKTTPPPPPVRPRPSAGAAAQSAPRTHLPLRTELAMLLRLLAMQGSWNYESLLGNGIGFCIEPALRLLPGGIHTPEFKAAMARQSRYFNCHPYLASVAVGALARVELDHEAADRIERFRTALAGPLGSVGDRLIWAGWLPL